MTVLQSTVSCIYSDSMMFGYRGMSGCQSESTICDSVKVIAYKSEAANTPPKSVTYMQPVFCTL